MNKKQQDIIHENEQIYGHERTRDTEHTHNIAHTHKHGDGHIHKHGDGPIHHHSEQEKRAIVNRLSRSIGHMQSVKNMVENDRDCSEVLIQLAAVKSAVNNTGKEILKQHISECIVEAVEAGDLDSIDKLNRAIDTFIK